MRWLSIMSVLVKIVIVASTALRILFVMTLNAPLVLILTHQVNQVEVYVVVAKMQIPHLSIVHTMRSVKMTNCEKYHNIYCRTCAFAPTGVTLTECNLQDTCIWCACYNKEKGCCHCHDEAGDSYTCKYYKENGR